MLTKEQFHILSVFKKDIFAALTFKQIKEQSRQKSNNLVQLALKEFLKRGLVTTQRVGDVTTYMLALDHNQTLACLNLINEMEIAKSKIPKNICYAIQERVFQYTEFFTLAVFGSYAKGKATPKSDLDIALIVESEETKKEITPYLETIRRRELMNIDYLIFTRTDFLTMLRADSENVGKQIYKHALIKYGYIPYCHLIMSLKHERRN